MTVRTILRFAPMVMFCFVAMVAEAQSTLSSKMRDAYNRFSGDGQLRYASSGFLLVDAASGESVFQYQPDLGLAPASTLKVVTSAAAFSLLGQDYRFPTQVSLGGAVQGGVLKGDLLVQGSGDPTLGSWRYPSMPDTAFLFQVWQALATKGVHTIQGDIVATNTRFSVQAIPSGWIYGDIGNYYGAGSWALNWHENQYDATYKASGDIGDTLDAPGLEPDPGIEEFHNFSTLGPAGSGDKSIIFGSPYSRSAYATGSLGKTNRNFTISGAMPNGEVAMLEALQFYLEKRGIAITGNTRASLDLLTSQRPVARAGQALTTFQSVGLDSVVYWFMQKSINLYGEALLKAMALKHKQLGDTETGAEFLRTFWEERGIDRQALRMQDGSGLSPQNRVTPRSLVQVLRYARSQPWFAAYYEAFPLIHNLKMKSGTIGGAKGYAGYITDKGGKTYCFAFLVNNYSGLHDAVVQKMWALLDVVSRHSGSQ